MTLIYFALFCSLLAVFSGIRVVGSGDDWHFTPADLMNGRENALAYVWVTCSTAFSIAHSCAIGLWIYIDGPAILGFNASNLWMPFHAGMGILFTAAHIFIKAKVVTGRGTEPRYLWGQ